MLFLYTLNILFFMFISTSALNQCDQVKINKISKSTTCSEKNALQKLYDMETFTFAFLPQDFLGDDVKCAKGISEAPNDHGFTVLHTYAIYKDGRNASVEYRQKTGPTCNHIIELDTKNIEYQIYLLDFEEIFCYYRCVNTHTDGTDFGACSVPISSIHEKKTLEDIKSCKKKLRDLGIKTKLRDLELCTE